MVRQLRRVPASCDWVAWVGRVGAPRVRKGEEGEETVSDDNTPLECHEARHVSVGAYHCKPGSPGNLRFSGPGMTSFELPGSLTYMAQRDVLVSLCRVFQAGKREAFAELRELIGAK